MEVISMRAMMMRTTTTRTASDDARSPQLSSRSSQCFSEKHCCRCPASWAQECETKYKQGVEEEERVRGQDVEMEKDSSEKPSDSRGSSEDEEGKEEPTITTFLAA